MAAQSAPRRLIRVENRAGEPVYTQDKTIIPLAISTIVQIPGLPVGLVWNRPSAVVIRFADDREEVLPVRDVTRQAQLALLGASASVLLFFLVWKVINEILIRRHSHE
jgi:hypothetical protein